MNKLLNLLGTVLAIGGFLAATLYFAERGAESYAVNSMDHPIKTSDTLTLPVNGSYPFNLTSLRSPTVVFKPPKGVRLTIDYPVDVLPAYDMQTGWVRVWVLPGKVGGTFNVRVVSTQNSESVDIPWWVIK